MSAVKPGACMDVWKHAADGDVEAVLAAITSGADVNGVNRGGKTLLHVAVEAGKLELVTALLAVTGINVNAKDAHGNQPVHYAASLQSGDIVEKLATVGRADLNSKDKRGDTPVTIAARTGNMAVLSELLKLPPGRCDLEAVGQNGFTAEAAARKWGKAEAVAAITQAKASREVRCGCPLLLAGYS